MLWSHLARLHPVRNSHQPTNPCGGPPICAEYGDIWWAFVRRWNLWQSTGVNWREASTLEELQRVLPWAPGPYVSAIKEAIQQKEAATADWQARQAAAAAEEEKRRRDREAAARRAQEQQAEQAAAAKRCHEAEAALRTAEQRAQRAEAALAAAERDAAEARQQAGAAKQQVIYERNDRVAAEKALQIARQKAAAAEGRASAAEQQARHEREDRVAAEQELLVARRRAQTASEQGCATGGGCSCRASLEQERAARQQADAARQQAEQARQQAEQARRRVEEDLKEERARRQAAEDKLRRQEQRQQQQSPPRRQQQQQQQQGPSTPPRGSPAPRASASPGAGAGGGRSNQEAGPSGCRSWNALSPAERKELETYLKGLAGESTGSFSKDWDKLRADQQRQGVRDADAVLLLAMKVWRLRQASPGPEITAPPRGREIIKAQSAVSPNNPAGTPAEVLRLFNDAAAIVNPAAEFIKNMPA